MFIEARFKLFAQAPEERKVVRWAATFRAYGAYLIPKSRRVYKHSAPTELVELES